MNIQEFMEQYPKKHMEEIYGRMVKEDKLFHQIMKDMRITNSSKILAAFELYGLPWWRN